MNRIVVYLLLSGVLLAWQPLFAESSKSGLESAFRRAGKNQNELKKALAEVPENQKKGMEFLILYMPKSDAQSLTAVFLLNNVAWAYKARETFPWAKQVPEDVFFNDVLPYASLDERRDDWRKDFFERFGKHVKAAKTQEQALAAVNGAILKEVKVKYSTKRNKANQSPYESMDQGLASCTGLSILLNNAFRAVGIPSRVVGTPAWTTKRGNHNWVEVWTSKDQQWHFTEYYPDSKGLDHGWLLADAAQGNAKSRRHSIYASSWKTTAQSFPMVWDMKSEQVPAVNVTQRYKELGGAGLDQNQCELRIHWIHDGKRMAVPVLVAQGDVKVEQGKSPSATDDMNRYFTVKVNKGQIYQVIWRDPETGAQKNKSITTPKDQDSVVVELAE